MSYPKHNPPQAALFLSPATEVDDEDAEVDDETILSRPASTAASAALGSGFLAGAFAGARSTSGYGSLRVVNNIDAGDDEEDEVAASKPAAEQEAEASFCCTFRFGILAISCLVRDIFTSLLISNCQLLLHRYFILCTYHITVWCFFFF
jgi:hypothetical protein